MRQNHDGRARVSTQAPRMPCVRGGPRTPRSYSGKGPKGRLADTARVHDGIDQGNKATLLRGVALLQPLFAAAVATHLSTTGIKLPEVYSSLLQRYFNYNLWL